MINDNNIMPFYVRDINHIVTQDEAKTMIDNATSPRDKFLVALLYLTGARPAEIIEMKKGDIKAEGDSVFFTIVNKKQGKRRGFTIEKRTLEINKASPFIDYILNWLNIAPDLLLLIRQERIRQIIYALSNNKLCPYNFRHTRLTKLSRSGFSVQELMYWKGAKDLKSVGVYLKGKAIGKSVVVE